MDRRNFLLKMACVTIAMDWTSPSHAQADDATLRMHASTMGRVAPSSFIGLSYELAQLTEPSFFSAEHKDLVALFRRLSPSGILRLGGNTSEFCWFRATQDTPAPSLRMPPGDLLKNWMPHRLFEIQPAAIDALSGFLDATGWTAIYGLNFGHGTPERAAAEAAYVQEKLGPRLAFFQIGNEPDFYRNANNGTRPAGWGFDDYLREWLGYANAVSARVPEAKFGGPDTGASSNWVTRFGAEVAPRLGHRLVALTGHYYAEGPPDDPRVTTARLLAGDPKVTASTEQIVRIADAYGLVYHMTEGNSCYRGGKPGMSNAFAASLWAGDYLLTLASLGCGGVNLHGGESRFLSAGLGGHNPGLATASGRKSSAPNGFYTPIRSEEGQPASAKPVFYGMLLAQQFAGATMINLPHLPLQHVTAYAAMKSGKRMVAFFNKAASGKARITLELDQRARRAELWKLSGSSLDATTGVTLGGSEVQNDGSWHPQAEPVPIHQNTVKLDIPGPSGMLIFVN